jgi:hypothetical protein
MGGHFLVHPKVGSSAEVNSGAALKSSFSSSQSFFVFAGVVIVRV